MRRRVLTVCGSLRSLSANRAAIDVAATYFRSRGDTHVDDYNDLAMIPPLNDAPNHDPGQAVFAWRERISRSDAVLIASPEYAGGVAGTIKNALDWIVGSGELYTKPVAVISAARAVARTPANIWSRPSPGKARTSWPNSVSRRRARNPI